MPTTVTLPHENWMLQKVSKKYTYICIYAGGTGSAGQPSPSAADAM